MNLKLTKMVCQAAGVVFGAGLCLVSCGTGELPTATELSAAVPHGSEGGVEGQVMAGINRYRAAQSKGVLKRHPGLDSLARHHAQRMLQEGKMSHKNYHHRLGMAEHYLKVVDLRENVFYSHGIGESQLAARTVQGWIESPGHRRNLLANTMYCGVGVAKGADGRYYAAQLSGKPASVESFYREGLPKSYSNVYGVGMGPDW